MQADKPAEKSQIRTKHTKAALQLVGSWAAGRKRSVGLPKGAEEETAGGA